MLDTAGPPRGREIAASSDYNKVARGPSARHRPGARKCSSRKQAQMLNSLDVAGSPQDTRVVVAMSGGVDSSVTAALLKAEGYDVVGVTLQLYDHGAATHRKGACCAGQDIYDARAVAERIGIPHYVLDYESRFKEMVIDRFAESYVAGAAGRLARALSRSRAGARPELFPVCHHPRAARAAALPARRHDQGADAR